MKRDALFDNAKLLLIFLVVFGHMIQPSTTGSTPLYTLYTWVYTFHMPAFILLAGFFAKGSGQPDYIIQLVKKLIIPYIIFQLVYTTYFLFMGKESGVNGLFYPYWSLWFLFSLFCWHLLLYLFKKLPPMIGMMIATIVGIGIGYVSDIGHAFSLSRTFVFFPFFLTGYWLTREHIEKWRTVRLRGASVVFMVLVAGLIAYFPEFSSGWLLGSKSYEVLGMPHLGGLVRLGVYTLAGLMTISFLAWVPHQTYRFTSLGGNTLYVYLLHGFFIHFFRETGLFKVDHPLDFMGLAMVSVIIVFLLSTNSIRTVTQPVIECRTQLIQRWWSRMRAQE